MPQVALKLRRKLDRVEIIRSHDAVISRLSPFPSFKPDTDADKRSYYHEFTLPLNTTPIQIDLSRLPRNYLSMDDVQEEVQHAYDKGFDDAQQLTRTTFEIELQKREYWVQNFDTVVQDLRSQFSKQISNFEESVISMGIIVAEHILQQEVSANSEIVVQQARKAIRAIDNDLIYKIHLHPYNVEVLEAVKSSLVSDTSRIENVELVPNEAIEPGSCLLETNSGIVDATFKAQLEKIKSSLRNTTVSTPLGTDMGNDYNEEVY